jgi:hypothetical protein
MEGTMSERELTAYICEHIFEGSRPVLLVAHEGGDWQFLCGGPHSPKAIPRVVGMNHILEADPSIRDVLNIPIDWEAERNAIGAEWTRTMINPAMQ